MTEPYTAIQVVMMPRDTNPHGTIFGGVILSHIDMAGAIAAARELQIREGNRDIVFVTVAINRVEFRKPVFVGDIVKYRTSVMAVGRTSMTIHVNVYAERGAEEIPVTEAEIVYVGIRANDPDRRPMPLLPDAPANP
jgi:acyl-CoA thioesterase YciA